MSSILDHEQHAQNMTPSVYAGVVIWFLMAWCAFGAWRLRRKRVTLGPAAGAMMDKLMDDNRRAAIEIIQEERTGERDPEDRDGNLPKLAGSG